MEAGGFFLRLSAARPHQRPGGAAAAALGSLFKISPRPVGHYTAQLRTLQGQAAARCCAALQAAHLRGKNATKARGQAAPQLNNTGKPGERRIRNESLQSLLVV